MGLVVKHIHAFVVLALHFNKAFRNHPKSLLYFSQDRIKKSSYF